MKPIAIIAAGMVTGVGLDAPSSCAAIRCAIDNFSETRFMDKGGEWIIGSQVPLEQPWRGLPKLVHMVVPAIRECLAQTGGLGPEKIPLLLCVAEAERPGRLEGLDDELLSDVQTELGVRFHPRSAVIPRGRVAGGQAMLQARQLIHDEHFPFCVIAGVDSLLVSSTLAAYEAKNRLLTSQNSNGFIPGEAGAAILVGPPTASDLLGRRHRHRRRIRHDRLGGAPTRRRDGESDQSCPSGRRPNDSRRGLPHHRFERRTVLVQRGRPCRDPHSARPQGRIRDLAPCRLRWRSRRRDRTVRSRRCTGRGT